jgi:septal ring factor EnvC (AmiA/AmiB activator)
VDQSVVQRQMDDLKKEMRQEIGKVVEDMAQVKQTVEKEMAEVKDLLTQLLEQQHESRAPPEPQPEPH